MTKNDNDAKKGRMPYSMDEMRLVEEGAQVIPHILTKLRAAVAKDTKDLLIAIASKAGDENNMDWIRGDPVLGGTQRRIAYALEYVIGDAEALVDSSDAPLSYDYGLDCVIELASEKHRDDEGGDAANVRELTCRVSACIAALSMQGDAQHALDLARFAGALRHLKGKAFVGSCDTLLKKGSAKKLGHSFDRLRVLKGIRGFIGRGEIPTKKAVRIKVFDENMDEGQFSRLISKMAVHEALPGAPTGSGSSREGVTYPFRSEERPSVPGTADENLRVPMNMEAGDEAVQWQSIDDVPGENPELVDCDIRRIKEQLGAVYWQLLIQFNMREPTEREDLASFLNKLKDIGLELTLK